MERYIFPISYTGYYTWKDEVRKLLPTLIVKYSSENWNVFVPYKTFRDIKLDLFNNLQFQKDFFEPVPGYFTLRESQLKTQDLEELDHSSGHNLYLLSLSYLNYAICILRRFHSSSNLKKFAKNEDATNI